MYRFGHCSDDLMDEFIDDYEEESLQSRESLSMAEIGGGGDPTNEQRSSLTGTISKNSRASETMDSPVTDAVHVDPFGTLAEGTPKREIQNPDTKTEHDDELVNTSAWQSEDAPWKQGSYGQFCSQVITRSEQQSDGHIVWGPLGTGHTEPTCVHWSTSDALVGMKRNSKSSDSGYYATVEGSGCSPGGTLFISASEPSPQNPQASLAQVEEETTSLGLAMPDHISSSVFYDASERTISYESPSHLADSVGKNASVQDRSSESPAMLPRSIKNPQVERFQHPLKQQSMDSSSQLQGCPDSPSQLQRSLDKSPVQHRKSVGPAVKHERPLALSSRQAPPESVSCLQESLSLPRLARSIMEPSSQHMGRFADSSASLLKTADSVAAQKPSSHSATAAESALGDDHNSSRSSLGSGTAWLLEQEQTISQAFVPPDLTHRTRDVKTAHEQAHGPVEGKHIPVSVSQAGAVARTEPCSQTAESPGDLGLGTLETRTTEPPATGWPELSPSWQESYLSWQHRRHTSNTQSESPYDRPKSSPSLSNVSPQRPVASSSVASNTRAQIKPDQPGSQPNVYSGTPDINQTTSDVHPRITDIACRTSGPTEKIPDIRRTPDTSQKVPDVCRSETESPTMACDSHAISDICQKMQSISLKAAHEDLRTPSVGPCMKLQQSPTFDKEMGSTMLATSQYPQASLGQLTASPAHDLASHFREIPMSSVPHQTSHMPEIPVSCAPDQTSHSGEIPMRSAPDQTSHSGEIPMRCAPDQTSHSHEIPKSSAPHQTSRSREIPMSSAPHQTGHSPEIPVSSALLQASKRPDQPMRNVPLSASIDLDLPMCNAPDRAGHDLDLSMNDTRRRVSHHTELFTTSTSDLPVSGIQEQSLNGSDEHSMSITHYQSGACDYPSLSAHENATRGAGEGFCMGAARKLFPEGCSPNGSDDADDNAWDLSREWAGDGDRARRRPDYHLQRSGGSGLSSDVLPSLLSPSLSAPACTPLLPAQAQTWVEMDVDKDHFVRTAVMEEAQEVLDSSSVVVITGPPHSGKTTLGRALLRDADHSRWTCCTITNVTEWRKWVGSGEPLIVLLDEVFGRTQLNKDKGEDWKQSLEGMDKWRRKSSLRLIFTVNPTVLESLRQAQLGRDLFSVQHQVSVGPLTDEEKREMLYSILQHKVDTAAVAMLETEARNQEDCRWLLLQEGRVELGDWDRLMEKMAGWVLDYDQSGSLFPDGCLWLATTLNRYNGCQLLRYLESAMKIFSRPAPLYRDIVLQLLQDRDLDLEKTPAVLCLLLAGMDITDANKAGTIVSKCRSLGFGCACSPIGLQDTLQAMKSTLIGEHSAKFINRHAYCGTALALGQKNCSMVVKVVDLPFLVKGCRVPMKDASHSEVDDNLKPFQLEIRRPKPDRSAQSSEYQALVGRFADELEDPQNMVWAVQHPVLQCREFVQDLKLFYMKQEKNVESVLSQNGDSTHGMSLLYWSVFNSDLFLFQWIFKTVIAQLQGSFRKEDLVKAAYACCVLRNKAEFLNMLLKYWKKATSEDRSVLLKGQHLSPQIPHLRMPLPRAEACLVSCWQDELKHINVLSSASLQREESEGAAAFEEQSQKPKKQGARSKGINLFNPPLLVAVEFNNEKIVDLLMTYHGDTLTVRDGQGQTALHVAAHYGHINILRKLLEHKELLKLKDDFGNTALDVACLRQDEEVMALLQH